MDEHFVHLATVVPGGFGGLFWDEQGRPNVYLTDTSKRAGAVTAVATSLRGRVVSLRQGQRPNLDDIQILQGRYDFPTLLRWRAQLDADAARIPGLVMLDADERRNRLSIGVETAEAEQQVRATLGRLRIPSEGVIIERRERPAPASGRSGASAASQAGTVEGYAAAVAGGYRIRWRTAPSYYDRCTFAFNAWRWDTPTSAWQRVFLTNSHCSNTRFGLDDARYYQWEHTNTAHYIGREIVDPAGIEGTEAATTSCVNSAYCCPQGYRCRMADAAVSLWESERWAYGRIARTLPGYPKTIDTANPTYNIAGEISFAYVGEVLYKVGATTGTSSASVAAACTWSYPSSGKKLLCQEEARFGTQGGDSGSPVYGLHPTAPGWVYLYGILQGTAIMSSMGNVESDFGTLDRYDCYTGNPDYPNCYNAS